MKISDIHSIYFLGIGGIGMSALARFFHLHGKKVSGYDKTPTALTKLLEEEGIRITYEDSLETIEENPDLIVLTPAIPKNHLQWNYYKEKKMNIKKRAEVLGLIANSMYNISIGGSHGKTSTSSMITHILKDSKEDVASFLGGIAVNYQSNFIDGKKYAIAEADEFDRSFLHLTPDILLLTSIDTDHLDIYGSYEKILESFRMFTSNLRPNGVLILNARVDKSVVHPHQKVLTYSIEDGEADFFGYNIHVKDGVYHFDMKTPHGIWENIVSSYGGRHNIENAVGAMAIAQQVGIRETQCKQAVSTFKGVKRRFETHVKNSQTVYMDDYAHHPTEIAATLRGVRELYPDKKITVCFQPHLFSRTKDLYLDFGTSLSTVEEVILLDIYPARELPLEGVTSQLILNEITIPNKKIATKEQLLEMLQAEKPEVFLTIGAGDIDNLVEPVKRILTNE